MKGYKGFNKDLTCRDFKFEVGKTYEIDGELEICGNGFHFCENPFDVFNYYPPGVGTRYCIVEALGETTTDGDKSATSKIKIVKEIDIKYLYDDAFALLDAIGTSRYKAHSQTSGY